MPPKDSNNAQNQTPQPVNTSANSVQDQSLSAPPSTSSAQSLNQPESAPANQSESSPNVGQQNTPITPSSSSSPPQPADSKKDVKLDVKMVVLSLVGVVAIGLLVLFVLTKFSS